LKDAPRGGPKTPGASTARFEVRAVGSSLFGVLIEALLESVYPGVVVASAASHEGELRPSDVVVEHKQTGRSLVVFGTPPTRELVARHFARGTHSLVGVDASRPELSAAIASLTQGPPYVAAGVVRSLAESTAEPSTESFHLTGREVDVIRLLVEGHSNNEIAVHLYVSPNTVRSHLQSISTKLGVASRAKIVARARALGIA
jgi:DNA-binding NarL/FixJ family response regulator